MTQIQCETSTQKWEKFETWIGRNIFEFEGTHLQKLYCFFLKIFENLMVFWRF